MLRLADTLVSPSEAGDSPTATSFTEEFSVTIQESEIDLSTTEAVEAPAVAAALRSVITTKEEEQEEAMVHPLRRWEAPTHSIDIARDVIEEEMTVAASTPPPAAEERWNYVREAAERMESPESDVDVVLRSPSPTEGVFDNAECFVQRRTSTVAVESTEDLPTSDSTLAFLLAIDQKLEKKLSEGCGLEKRVEDPRKWRSESAEVLLTDFAVCFVDAEKGEVEVGASEEKRKEVVSAKGDFNQGGAGEGTEGNGRQLEAQRTSAIYVASPMDLGRQRRAMGSIWNESRVENVEEVESPEEAPMLTTTIKSSTKTAKLKQAIKLEHLCEKLKKEAIEFASRLGIETGKRRKCRTLKSVDPFQELTLAIKPSFPDVADVTERKTGRNQGRCCQKRTTPRLEMVSCSSVECPETAEVPLVNDGMQEGREEDKAAVVKQKAHKRSMDLEDGEETSPALRRSAIFEAASLASSASSKMNHVSVGVLAEALLTSTVDPLFESISRVLGDVNVQRRLSAQNPTALLTQEALEKEEEAAVVVAEKKTVEKVTVERDSSSKQKEASRKKEAASEETEEKAEVILPEVSESLKKIEANLRRLRTATQMAVAPETPEMTTTPTTAPSEAAILPQNIEMYTHQKFGLKVAWSSEEMETGVAKKKKLTCSIANLRGEAWAEQVVEMER